MAEIVFKYSKEKIKLFIDNFISLFMVVLFSVISLAFIYNFIAAFIYLSFKTLLNGIGPYDISIISIIFIKLLFIIIPLHITGTMHLKFFKETDKFKCPLIIMIILLSFIIDILATILFYNTLDYTSFYSIITCNSLISSFISLVFIFGSYFIENYRFEINKEYFKKLLNL